MLTVRFNRVGKKNKPYYRIVLQEHTVAPGGGHVEVLGSYDPHAKKAVLREDRIKYWQEKGVKFSDSVYNLLITNKVISGEKRTVTVAKKEEAPAVEEAKAEAVETKEEEVTKEETK